MTQPLRVGIKLSQDAPIASYKTIWQIADEAGFDHCWAMDHLASIGHIGEDRPIFDGWELLAGMAMATSHVRIGLLVTGITYRNPALLAKIATTVDHLSDGRLEFGIGAAWAANEHEMYGISGLDHRVGLFSEGLQVIKSLWTQERTDFEGRYFTMQGAVANPKRVRKPYPPIWRHRRRRRVEADRRGLRRHRPQPPEIRRSAQVTAGQDPAELIDRVHGFAAAGFSEIIIMLSGGTMSSDVDPVRTAAMVAETVLPELRN